MAPFAGIDIQIISEGRPSKLHPDPDGEGHQHPTIRQRYVQATTGAQFTVKVGLNKDFNWFALRPDDAVRFTVQYDNQIATWYHDFPAPKLLFARDRRERLEYSFSTVSIFDRELQQWKAADICFGALEAKDSSGHQVTSSDLENLGRIRVTAQRVLRTRRALPHHNYGIHHKPVTEVSEKLLKGKAITNTVHTTNETVSTAPPPSEYDISPLPGPGGEPLITNVLYRSKSTLQMLGCIPRSPSPEPEPPLQIDEKTSCERRIQNLRAQLALLEGDANIKAEGTGARRGIKRELEDTENVEVTEVRSARKRSRHSGSVETVDLTGD